jgi:hypothetical protein
MARTILHTLSTNIEKTIRLQNAVVSRAHKDLLQVNLVCAGLVPAQTRLWSSGAKGRPGFKQIKVDAGGMLRSSPDGRMDIHRKRVVRCQHYGLKPTTL